MKKLKLAIISLLTVILFVLGEVSSYATSSSTDSLSDKSNNYLQSLSVEGYEISPEFNKNTITYYLVIPTSVTSLNVLAEAEIENATVKITGNTSLKSKENTIKIVVTAKNRTTKTYNIIATRQDDNGIKLSSLSIEGGTFSEEFNESKYNYTVDVLSSKDTTDLVVNAVPNSEDAQVEIIGNTGLEAGTHLITILLKKDSSVTTYEITVNLSVEKTIINEVKNDDLTQKVEDAKTYVINFFKDENKTLAFLVAIAAIMLLLVIILIVKITKKNKADKNREKLVKRAKK